MNRPLQYAPYAAIRERMNTGDLVFFAGNGFVSRIIRFFTLSAYSHVAIVLRTEATDRVTLMESTSIMKGVRGVSMTYLSDRLKDYEGRADIAILSKDARATLNAEACREFLYKCVGKPYDTRGALLSALGQWFRIPGKERLDSLFCSELADASHRAGGLCFGDDHTPTPEEMAERPIIEAFFRVREAA